MKRDLRSVLVADVFEHRTDGDEVVSMVVDACGGRMRKKSAMLRSERENYEPAREKRPSLAVAGRATRTGLPSAFSLVRCEWTADDSQEGQGSTLAAAQAALEEEEGMSTKVPSSSEYCAQQ
jgi:hypothetical protein